MRLRDCFKMMIAVITTGLLVGCGSSLNQLESETLLPEIDVVQVKEYSEEALKLALALEEHSEHPLAKSVIDYVQKENTVKGLEKVDGFKALVGLGVRGKVGGKEYHFGSSRYMDDLKVLSKDSHKEIEKMQEKGYTVLCLSDDENVLALFGVQDGIKESSKYAIDLLKKRLNPPAAGV